MTLRCFLGLFLTSALAAGCTDRTGDIEPDESTADTEPATDTGDDDPTDGDDGSGDTSGECEGETCDDDPVVCEGDAPWCVPAEDVSGTCSHGPDYEATCEDGEWACPEGFIFEDEAECVPDCEGAGCVTPCEPGAVPPDECWDQGPGECADSTVPPTCTDGVWVCPNGFDFGGFGEGCTFPGE